MMHQPGKYISTSDVADRWSVSQKTVQRLIQTGCLKAIKIGLKRYSVLAESVLDYERMKETISIKCN
jgi:excisionase family DNA binding protein